MDSCQTLCFLTPDNMCCMRELKTTHLNFLIYKFCTLKQKEHIFGGLLLLKIDILAAILDFYRTKIVIIIFYDMFIDEVDIYYLIKTLNLLLF